MQYIRNLNLTVFFCNALITSTQEVSASRKLKTKFVLTDIIFFKL